MTKITDGKKDYYETKIRLLDAFLAASDDPKQIEIYEGYKQGFIDKLAIEDIVELEPVIEVELEKPEIPEIFEIPDKIEIPEIEVLEPVIEELPEVPETKPIVDKKADILKKIEDLKNELKEDLDVKDITEPESGDKADG